MYDALVVGARCAGAPTAAPRHDQAQADRFFGTIAGAVPIPEFFAPENVGRIMAPAPSEKEAA
jgi:hypothetical protein